MTNKNSGFSCTQMCWALAVAIALAALLIFALVLKFGAIGSIFFAAVVFVVAGLLLTWICCSDLKSTAPGTYTVGNTAPADEESAGTMAAAPEPQPEPTPEPTPEPVAVVTPEAPVVEEPEIEAPVADTPAAAPAGEDYDRDGIVEGTDEGEKPATLDGPRDGGADDLKQIKGVGPKLEKMLNGMGFWHFDQVANWTDQEVAWVDANLEGFKGRVSRDQWVAQASVLAGGGETEFSKRVEEGDVY